MKISNHSIYMAVFLMFGCQQLSAQAQDGAIKTAIEQFAQAADANDTQAMEAVLHPNYRIVWPIPDKEPMIVDQSVYLEKIGSKEWGGDQRMLTIQWIKTNGSHATALIHLDGKAKFRSLLDLVKVKDKWLVIQDAVEMLP